MTIGAKWATIKTDDVMNDQDNKNTLISQGSRLQQLSGKKKSNLAVAMFAILFFHAAVLGALLIQGCKQEPPQPEATATNEVAIPTINVVANPLIGPEPKTYSTTPVKKVVTCPSIIAA